jgi:hypothetical protein
VLLVPLVLEERLDRGATMPSQLVYELSRSTTCLFTRVLHPSHFERLPGESSSDSGALHTMRTFSSLFSFSFFLHLISTACIPIHDARAYIKSLFGLRLFHHSSGRGITGRIYAIWGIFFLSTSWVVIFFHFFMNMWSLAASFLFSFFLSISPSVFSSLLDYYVDDSFTRWVFMT